MARTQAAQRTLIGRETTTGTAVAATRELSSLSVALSPEVESSAFRPRGTKYPTVVAANREHATGDLEGTPTYDELVYPLSSILTSATVAAVMNGGTPTGAYAWTFSPSSRAADTPVTYTVEQGDAALAERAAHLLFTDFGMAFSRSEVSLSGSAFAKALERGRTLTTGTAPVSADVVPILPGSVCVYVSDTVAGLGTDPSHVKNALSIEPSLGSRFNPVWFLNCREASFSGFVETPEPDASVDLTIEADAGGLTWADHFRTGATRFIRVESRGPLIAPGVEPSAYRLTWDMAVKVLEPGDYSDEDGVYAIAPSLQIVHDPTWGRAMQVTVVNKVAAL
jgi:hypothetical protein